MTKLQQFLQISLLFIEFLCALTAVFNYNKLKNNYWKWFCIYVVMIFIFEMISYFGLEAYPDFRKYYFDYLVIPFQFLFFYWFYACKLLENRVLFRWFCFIYLSVFAITHIFEIEKTRVINELSYSFGVMLLFFLIIMDFFRQIKSDNILKFNISKMFYINLGLFIFYVGTFPFFAFDGFSFENTKTIWMNYFTVFLFLNNCMYLLFTASFIWGKQDL